MSAERPPSNEIIEKGLSSASTKQDILKKRRIDSAKFGAFMAFTATGAAALVCSEDERVQAIGGAIFIGVLLYPVLKIGKKEFDYLRGKDLPD